MTTHWGYWDAPKVRDRSRMLCGVYAADDAVSTEPTCPICARLLAEREADDHEFDETDLALGLED